MLELMEALQQENNLVALAAFRTIDLNKDGVLTFNEYLRRLFPHATEREFAAMQEWAFPTKPVAVQEPTFEPTSEQLEEIRKMFSMYDSNHNAKIEMTELLSLSERCGFSQADIASLFKASDKDANGSISLAEFVELMKVSYI
ncbi:Calcium-binding allergen Ole e 8 [Tetrabaena socialis]|uniref:Calcium-binding allergen Ole e 8 n=1 Tax=Tetrabaena socialis TaxID=47790 RepID=A0A2J8AJP9_9CHLO|nr:Calcium-binding allergen Ole e 8 [Tetrabaena socialis]|eukprot:PNH12752.1 Calcium-binding allergen Ole e 8 [Tetrabaena socialis]